MTYGHVTHQIRFDFRRVRAIRARQTVCFTALVLLVARQRTAMFVKVAAGGAPVVRIIYKFTVRLRWVKACDWSRFIRQDA